MIMKAGDYVKIVNTRGISSKEVGDIVKVTEQNASRTQIKFEGNDFFWRADRFEPLPILTEPVPIGSKVVKIKRNEGSKSDKYIGEIITTCEPAYNTMQNNQWIEDPSGQKYWISDISLDNWALVEAAKVETEFQVGDRVVPKVVQEEVATREFQGECLNIDQLLAKCHTLAAKKSFISKIFKKGYWV